jgi:hypothetical protein
MRQRLQPVQVQQQAEQGQWVVALPQQSGALPGLLELNQLPF